MSRYLRIRRGVAGERNKGKRGLPLYALVIKYKAVLYQGLEASDKLNICVIKIINNLLNTYDNYYGRYRILLIFNKVTS